MAKKLNIKVDGLSPKDLAKIRMAVRQIWHRSYPRKLCVARSLGPAGFPICEACKATVPKTYIDHKVPVGDLLNGGIERMFTPSRNLQALCKKCHDVKTKSERASKRHSKNYKASNNDIGDFY